jgi:hypothetical protein
VTIAKNTRIAMNALVDALVAEVLSRSPSNSDSNSARPPGQKRDPKEIDAVTEKLLAYIRKHPGERIEPIGKALGLPTKDLLIPVKRLVGSKHIRTRGQKRATTYFAR